MSGDPEVDEEIVDRLLEDYLEGLKSGSEEDSPGKIDDTDKEQLKLSLREKVLDENIDALVGLYFRNLVQNADVKIHIEL